MEQNKVAELYNLLFRFEQDRKGSAQYPIHKKLIKSFEFEDIYAYIISTEQIQNKSVLDAGCGVGYGSLLLAKNGAEKVHGISISALEVERAMQFQSHDKLTFEVATFQEIKKESYDLIICVESLKHSLDFQIDYQKLLDGLKENGKLIVVDDFYEGLENKSLRTFMKKWALNYILREENLMKNAENYRITKVDLSEFVDKKPFWKLKIIRFFSRYFLLKKIYDIFDGGWILDEFYTRGLMKYNVCKIEKK